MLQSEHAATIELLKQTAKLACGRAYAPYSNFKVGAAALTSSGKVVSGCNVENSSYGLTVCAERNCIAQAVAAGEQQFKTLLIYTEQDTLTAPCGACRQVIAEFLQPDTRVCAVNHLGAQVEWTVQQLLPDAFSSKHLE